MLAYSTTAVITTLSLFSVLAHYTKKYMPLNEDIMSILCNKNYWYWARFLGFIRKCQGDVEWDVTPYYAIWQGSGFLRHTGSFYFWISLSLSRIAVHTHRPRGVNLC